MAGVNPSYIVNERLNVRLLQDKFTLTNLGYEATAQQTINVSTTSVSRQLTDEEFVRAMITVENNPIRVWASGENPTAASGHFVKVDDIIVLDSPTQIKKFRAIAVGGPAILQITFYRPYDSDPPDAVRGLTAMVGVRLVTLSWERSTATDLAGYNIYRNGTKINTTLITDSYYTVQGLIPGQLYNFQVTAVDLYNNESSRGEMIPATPLAPDTIPPSVPTGILIDPGHESLKITWEPSPETDVAGYNVYIDNNIHNQGLLTVTTYTAEGLLIDQSYSVRITAVDTSGNESAKSAEVFGIPVDLTPPMIPANFAATPGDRRVVLTWSANQESNLAGYNVYRNGTRLNQGPVTVPTYTVNNLANGVEYTFQLSAITTNNVESNKTVPITIAPKDNTIPATPTGLVVTYDDQILRLVWNPNPESDLAGYNVYRDNIKVNTTALITMPSYTLTGLINGTSYSIQVSAVDTSGNESPRTTAVQGVPNDPALIMGDEFNRVTTDDLGTANTGQTYIYYGPGIWKCTGTSATVQSADAFEINYAVVDLPGYSDCSIETHFVNAPNGHLGLAFRMSADDVGLSIRPNVVEGAGVYAFYKDTQTILKNTTASCQDNDVIKVVLNGPNIDLYVNGNHVDTHTTTDHMTNTQHGLVSRSARGANYLKIRRL